MTLQERTWQWFVAHARSRYSLVWLAAVAFTDAIFFPLAPEVFLVALTIAHKARARTYLAVAATFSALGALAGYVIAAFLFRQFGAPILEFYHLGPAFAEARRLIGGHVFLTMAVASFTPVPDKVFIYAGGFLGVHVVPFWLGYVLGRTARMGIVVYLSERFGQEALGIIRRYLAGFAAIAVALAIIYAMVRLHLFGLLP